MTGRRGDCGVLPSAMPMQRFVLLPIVQSHETKCTVERVYVAPPGAAPFVSTIAGHRAPCGPTRPPGGWAGFLLSTTKHHGRRRSVADRNLV